MGQSTCPGCGFHLPEPGGVRVRDVRGNTANIPGGGTARQIALEAAWWWGYTIIRSEHFTLADSNANALSYDDHPASGEYELVAAGSTV